MVDGADGHSIGKRHSPFGGKSLRSVGGIVEQTTGVGGGGEVGVEGGRIRYQGGAAGEDATTFGGRFFPPTVHFTNVAIVIVVIKEKLQFVPPSGGTRRFLGTSIVLFGQTIVQSFVVGIAAIVPLQEWRNRWRCPHFRGTSTL